MHFQSSSEAETILAAKALIASYQESLADKPLVLALHGEMGSGKTRFAKGVAEALGITEVVSSPSYVLTREYHGELGTLIHIDCWRTPAITPEELNLESYLKPGTVVVIEWPEPLLSYLKEQDITLVELEMSGDGETREIIQK